MALTSNLWEDEPTWPCLTAPGKEYTREGCTQQVWPVGHGRWETFHVHTDGTRCHLARVETQVPGEAGPWQFLNTSEGW